MSKRVELTLRSGAQIQADVDSLELGRTALGDLARISWTTSETWTAKLYYVRPEEVVAVVMLEEEVG
jgi:hypothetical protein